MFEVVGEAHELYGSGARARTLDAHGGRRALLRPCVRAEEYRDAAAGQRDVPVATLILDAALHAIGEDHLLWLALLGSRF